MPRRSRVTTISLSPELRETLAAMKPRGRSFGDLLELMVSEKTVDGWEEKLGLMEEDALARVQARKAGLVQGAGVRRDPSEQKLLAEVARDRWNRWQALGRVRKLDDRKWTYEARARGGSGARIRRTR